MSRFDAFVQAISQTSATATSARPAIVRAPAEAPLPESVADDHRGRTSGSAIRFREITSHRRLDAQDGEIRPRHSLAFEALGDAAVGERHRPARVASDVLEARLLRRES